MEIELFEVVVNAIEFFVEFNRLGIPGRVIHNAPLHTACTSLQSDLKKKIHFVSVIQRFSPHCYTPYPEKYFPSTDYSRKWTNLSIYQPDAL